MSDWITDRLPTDDDADCEGKVWITRDSAVERTDFLNVMLRRAWMPIDSPPPYVAPPPEPDTSLELDRAEKWVADVLDETPLGRVFYSIIDAARKWDEYGRWIELAEQSVGDTEDVEGIASKALSIKETTEMCAASTDPDGVGEGWRRLKEGDERKYGDEYQQKGCDWWRTANPDLVSGKYTRYDMRDNNYRRRIEPAEKFADEACPICNGPHPPGRCAKQTDESYKGPTVSKPTWVWTAPKAEQPAKVRFEAYIDSCVDCDGDEHEWQHSKRIREVLPGDPTPEWIDELIRLCERPETEGSYGYHEMIQQHLAKRGANE